MLWDIFCRVIDNFGDIGVCCRLCADLATRGHSVRLWVDDTSALEWMAPGALQGEWPRIQVRDWDLASSPEKLQTLLHADVWIESFGCEIPEPFVAHFANESSARPPVWINLEYLSAESYVERSHALPSPILRGPASGWTKYFFYPGFTAQTGGLLREAGVGTQPSATLERAHFLEQHSVSPDADRVVSLFCYEPPLLKAVLDHFAQGPETTQLLVTQGRASGAVQTLLGQQTRLGQLQVSYLPLLTQPDFDVLLRSCDLNFVRGEDSVVRAIWAGKPFVWHIYPQDDGADAPKLEAFLEQLQLGAPVRQLHRAWNCLLNGADATNAVTALRMKALKPWQDEVLAARDKLLKMDDLCTQLHQFVQKKR